MLPFLLKVSVGHLCCIFHFKITHTSRNGISWETNPCHQTSWFYNLLLALGVLPSALLLPSYKHNNQSFHAFVYLQISTTLLCLTKVPKSNPMPRRLHQLWESVTVQGFLLVFLYFFLYKLCSVSFYFTDVVSVVVFSWSGFWKDFWFPVFHSACSVLLSSRSVSSRWPSKPILLPVSAPSCASRCCSPCFKV